MLMYFSIVVIRDSTKSNRSAPCNQIKVFDSSLLACVKCLQAEKPDFQLFIHLPPYINCEATDGPSTVEAISLSLSRSTGSD